MRVVRVSPILLSSIFLLGAVSASAQGIGEMGAVNASAASQSSVLMNKNNTSGLEKAFGAASGAMGGASKGSGTSKGASATDDGDPDHYDPHVTVAKAGKYSNDLYTLGKAKEAAGKLKEAEQYYRQSIEYRKRIWGMNDPAVQTLTEKIGDLSAKRGAYAEAGECYQRVLMSQIKKYGQGEFVLTPVLTKLGQNYQHLKKYSDAINSFDQVYKLSERKLGAQDSKTVQAAVNLAKADLEQPEYMTDGLDLMKMYTDMLDKGDATSSNPVLLSVLDTYTEALQKTGKTDLAATVKTRADKVREAVEAAKASDKEKAAEKGSTDKVDADKAAATAKTDAKKPVSKKAAKAGTKATSAKAVKK